MSEGTEYFKKSETSAPSILFDCEKPMPTSSRPSTIEIKRATSSRDDLINQDIINVNDYRKNKATKRVIAHVPFKPD
jgi:hypothetical protein